MEEKIKIYEKCNTTTEKEIWNILMDTDFKDASKIKILDIGCGPGDAFFHFYVNFGTSDFIGIELKSLNQIKGDLAAFKNYGGEDGEKLLYWLDENRSTIDPYLYFQKLIDYDILKPDPKINEHKFKSLFMNKILWGTKIEESNIFKKPSDKYDLIILSKVLHYKDIDNPGFVIKNCVNLLTENGLIFIKSRKIQETSKKRKIDEIIFEEWTENLKEHKKIENDSKFLYFLGKK